MMYVKLKSEEEILKLTEGVKQNSLMLIQVKDGGVTTSINKNFIKSHYDEVVKIDKDFDGDYVADLPDNKTSGYVIEEIFIKKFLTKEENPEYFL